MKLLIVRRDNIGDLLCTTPMLHALRLALPDADIDLLVNSYNAEVVRANPDVDRVFVYTKLKHRPPSQSRVKAALAQLTKLLRLRRERYDALILPGLTDSPNNKLLVRLVGARRVFGWVRRGEVAASYLTDPVELIESPPRHEVDHMMTLLAALLSGFSLPPASLPISPLCLVVDADSKQRWQRQLDSRAPGKERLILHISARQPIRRLPEAVWQSVIDTLSARYPDLALLLCWSPGDAATPTHPGDDLLAERLLAYAGERLIPCPTPTLGDLFAVFANANAFIGGDGGAVHVAAACQLRVVAWYEDRADKYQRWRPWATPHHLLLVAAGRSLGVDAIVAAYQSLSNETAHRPQQTANLSPPC